MQQPLAQEGDAQAQQDLYQLRLDDPFVRLIAGDGGWSLSPLLSGFGSGGAARASVGPLALSALWFTGRRVYETGTFVGGGAEVEIAQPLTFGVQGLQRWGVPGGGYSGTASAGLRLGQALSAEVEGGLGASYYGDYSRLLSASLNLRHGPLSARASIADTGPYGAGALRDRFNGQAVATWRQGRSFRVRLRGVYQESAPAGRSATGRGVVYARTGISAERREAFRLRLDRSYRSNALIAGGFEQSLYEGAAELEFGWSGAAIRPELTGGVLRERTGEGRSSSLTYGTGLEIATRWDGPLRLAADARFRSGGLSASQGQSRTYTAGARASWAPAPGWQFRLGSAYAVTDGRRRFGSASATAGVEARLPWGHEVSLDAGVSRRSLGGLDGLAAVSASAFVRYAVPLSVPLYRDRRSGMVRGQLVDAQTGIPLPDVPVYLEQGGGRIRGAYTRADGRYTLADVPVGLATVVVDAESGGLAVRGGHRRAARVSGGQATQTDFEVTRAAGLRLSVMSVDTALVAGPDGSPIVTRRPIDGAVVRVTGEDEELELMTDRLGVARSSRVPVGTYALSVTRSPLPDYAPVSDSVRVEIRPGAVAEADLLLARKRRRVVIADGPALSLSLPAPASSSPEASDPVEIHTVSRGDTFRSIAAEVYGDGALWEHIRTANPGLRAYPPDADLPNRRRLRIPAPPDL
jgi:hypothetical protein